MNIKIKKLFQIFVNFYWVGSAINVNVLCLINRLIFIKFIISLFSESCPDKAYACKFYTSRYGSASAGKNQNESRRKMPPNAIVACVLSIGLHNWERHKLFDVKRNLIKGMCTHLHIAFDYYKLGPLDLAFDWRNSSLEKLEHFNDLDSFFSKIVPELRQTDPNLKLIFSIGQMFDWEGSQELFDKGASEWAQIGSSVENGTDMNAESLYHNSIGFVRKFGLDGIDFAFFGGTPDAVSALEGFRMLSLLVSNYHKSVKSTTLTHDEHFLFTTTLPSAFYLKLDELNYIQDETWAYISLTGQQFWNTKPEINSRALTRALRFETPLIYCLNTYGYWHLGASMDRLQIPMYPSRSLTVVEIKRVPYYEV